MENIMLDVETLGNTTNSAILQVAMVKFDEEGNIGASLSIRIDTEEQLRLGAEKTQSTLDWWQKTNPVLLESLMTEDLMSVDQAIAAINRFVGFNDKIWCHATFDLPILGNLYRLAGKRVPWSYKLNRDIRTLVDVACLDLSEYDWVKEKTHDALDDCCFQIKYTTDAIKKIKSWRV